MVYITDVFCDWMTCVAPDTTKETWIRHHFDWLKNKPIKGGAYGHKYAVELYPIGITHHFSANLDIPSVLVIPGHAWSAIREKWGESDTLKIMRIFARHCDHITRIDLAMDIFDGGDLAYEVSDAILANRLDSGRRKTRTIRGGHRSDGCTNYIGSRTSPKFLRVYDKNAESNGAVPCTRLEFELKAASALAVQDQLSLYEGFLKARPIFIGLLRDFIELEHFPKLEAIMYGDVKVLDIPPHQRMMDKQQWLIRQVLPSFDRFRDGDAFALWMWFKHEVEKNNREA